MTLFYWTFSLFHCFLFLLLSFSHSFLFLPLIVQLLSPLLGSLSRCSSFFLFQSLPPVSPSFSQSFLLFLLLLLRLCLPLFPLYRRIIFSFFCIFQLLSFSFSFFLSSSYSLIFHPLFFNHSFLFLPLTCQSHSSSFLSFLVTPSSSPLLLFSLPSLLSLIFNPFSLSSSYLPVTLIFFLSFSFTPSFFLL